MAKHFECPYGTGASITPDGVIVMADGTVLALDVVVVGTGDKAQETARRKRFGWGSLGALERAKRALAATWEKTTAGPRLFSSCLVRALNSIVSALHATNTWQCNALCSLYSLSSSWEILREDVLGQAGRGMNTRL